MFHLTFTCKAYKFAECGRHQFQTTSSAPARMRNLSLKLFPLNRCPISCGFLPQSLAAVASPYISATSRCYNPDNICVNICSLDFVPTTRDGAAASSGTLSYSAPTKAGRPAFEFTVIGDFNPEITHSSTAATFNPANAPSNGFSQADKIGIAIACAGVLVTIVFGLIAWYYCELARASEQRRSLKGFMRFIRNGFTIPNGGMRGRAHWQVFGEVNRGGVIFNRPQINIYQPAGSRLPVTPF